MDNLRKRLKKSKGLVRAVRKTRNFVQSIFTASRPDPFKDIWRLSQTIDLRNPVFVDGGAHNGSTVLRIRDEGFYDSKIYAFEPIPEAAKGIVAFGDDKVIVREEALGNIDGLLDFNVNKRAVTSSALAPEEVERYHPDMATLARKITVPCARIDTLVQTGSIEAIDIIKLDLQGYELNALKGAERSLANVKMILCETEFVPFYKDQALYHDIAAYLQSRGFSLFSLYNISFHANGQILAADALFLNKAFFK